MGDIKRDFSELQIKENQFLDLLRNEKRGTNRTFKLKGPSSFLFSNFAVLALASCGGGGGGSTPAPTPTPPPSNNAPNMGANTTFSFTEDTAASFGIGAPADADGDTLTITVDSIPTGGVLTLEDGTPITAGSTLTIAQLEGITFTPNSNVNSTDDTIGGLVLTVTDGNGGSDSATFSFEVTAVDDAPTSISLDDSNITENVLGDNVGLLNVLDVDSSSFAYVLSGQDAALFEVVNGNLKFKDSVSADYEANTSYDVIVTASDSSGNSVAQAFTVTVIDANDAPTAVTISNVYISENIAGVNVGTLSTTDSDAGNTYTYTLSGSDADSFEISGSTLKLKSSVSADYENKSTYSVTVTSTDNGGASKEETLTITVLDNAAPTNTTLSSSVLNENSAGVEIGTLSSSDPDTGETFSYTLSGTDADSFEISGSTLKLKSSVSADYETKSSYSITITVTDSDGNTFSKDFSLNVTNLSEPETITGTVVDGYVSGSTVKVLDANGNLLGTATTDSLGRYTIEASDSNGVKIVAEGGVDTSTGETITITLSATKGSSYVSALTTIIEKAGDDADTVLANLGLPADFDLATSNPLENVEAQKVNASLINIIAVGETLLENAGLTDGAGDELIIAELVTLLTTSSDFNSTTAIKSVIDASVSTLDTAIQTKVSNLSDDVSASLATLNKEIEDSASVGQIATIQKVTLDDEGSFLSSVVLAVTTDQTELETISAEEVTTASKAAALDLGVNVAPFITLDALIQVKENIISGDGVVTVLASDPEGESIVYSLGGSDSAFFSIDNDGKISFISSPDYSSPVDKDTDNVYEVDVIATDASGNAATKTISIQVLDVKGQGQAIDGYLVGAIVWADLDGDGLMGVDEPTTATDATGSFGLDADLPEGTILYVEGGYDLGTGKPNEQVFKLTVSKNASDGTEDLIISPVSTQIARAFAKGTTTLDNAQTKVAAAYGLDEAFGDITSFDPIELAYEATSQEQAEAALTAQARNIMVSTLGETSMKVSEYFTTEIAPVVRSQISDLFKQGTDILSYTSWDSQVDLRSQPRITIELEGFEELLAASSEVFNDKIVDAILDSTDLTKLFEMKADGTGQFDAVITDAVDAIITQIKNTVLEEMGFDPATGYTSFVDLAGYEGETVEFLGSTKTMGEWAVLIADILDSDRPSPFDGKVHFGPDGGITDNVGKYFAERMSAMARHIENIFNKPLSEMTDDQIDQIVDMGMEYARGSTFSDNTYTRWVPFDEYGQELWSQTINFTYSGVRFQYDSNGNWIQGNSGNYQLTPDQVKAYLKDSTLQLKDGNWGNDFTSYNWNSTVGDLGIYLALSKARNESDVATYMDALTTSDDGVVQFKGIIDSFFDQGTTVFTQLVTAALEFTLDKFTAFIERTIDIENEVIMLDANIDGMPVSTITTKEVNGETYELYTTQGIEWLVNSWGRFNLGVEESGDFVYAITGGPDAARFRIDDTGTISFADTRPGKVSSGSEITDNLNPGSPGSPGGTGSGMGGGISDEIQYDDVGKDGKYFITVSISDGDFTQTYDIVLKFPQWNFNQRDVSSDYPSLSEDQQVIQMNEHSSLLTSYDEATVIESEEEEDLSLGNDGFALNTFWIQVLDYTDYTEDGDGNSNVKQHDYSSQFLPLSAANPESGEYDSQFTYYNNLNLENILGYFNGEGISPRLQLAFDSIPEAGASGSATLNVKFANGRDHFGANEEQGDYYNVTADTSITSSIQFNWSSDGTNITVEIPEQEQVLTITNSDSSTETVTLGNVNTQSFSFNNQMGQDTARGHGKGELSVLDLRILDLFVGNGNLSEVPQDFIDFFKEGAYRFEADFDGLSWLTPNPQHGSKSNIISNFDINSNKATAYAVSQNISEGEGGRVEVVLTQPLTEDVTLEYFVFNGDPWGAFQAGNFDELNFQDGTSGTITIPAGEDRASIHFYSYTDGENEPTESYTVVFTDFQTEVDGVRQTVFENLNWGGSTASTVITVENTNVTVSKYEGYELIFENAPQHGQGWIQLRDRDDSGNKILDNEHFYIHHDHHTDKYYLQARNGTFDYDNPLDRDGDNVYELEIQITKFGSNGEDSISTKQQFLLVVNDSTDPTIEFWQENPEWSYSESSLPVASLQTLNIDGTEVDAFFASGNMINVGVRADRTYVDDSGTPDARLIWPHGNQQGSFTYTITGGADADKFIVHNGYLLFTTRPSFDNPSDANADNGYEVEVTVVAGTSEITNTYTIKVNDSEEGVAAIDPPEQLPIYLLKEVPELIGDSEAPKNIRGTDSDDVIKVNPDRFQYIQGGKGDDVLDPGRHWEAHGHLTGGEGNDVYIFRENYMTELKYFGIRDYSKPDVQVTDENGNPRTLDGINGYDQNRDGVLDLGSELDWTRVVLIADFTPGEDTIALTTSGQTGFNRLGFTKENIYFQQGTGDLADHTLVLTSDAEWYDGGVGLLGVLLNIDATTLDVDRDLVEAGAQYETILGKFDIAPSTSVDMTLDSGRVIQIQQLENGDYVWFEANYDSADNEVLYQTFSVSTDGIIYATRPDEIDFENPLDSNKDNIYQFEIRATTFSNISFQESEHGDLWVDWNNSERTGEIAFTAVLNVQDDINDNLGKISIAETSYMKDDGTVNKELIELVLRQISAVQSSMADIDMRAIAEEINFDFSRFTTAMAEEREQEWFQNDIAERFEDWGRELEETFEQNLINKYNDFTDAYGLGSLVGDAGNNIIKGEGGNETIFGKAGDDTIAGGEGDDVLFGDTGDDTLSGGPGTDRLDGGSGDDRLIVDEGADVIAGGGGDDIIYFSTLTEIPEFVDGGGGEDTLVLAGMPESIGSTSFEHDNTAYTGIDLKKIISAKETWNWTDDQGNTVSEEGWRNRIESIEVIDLRDSSSLLNVEQTADTYDGFRLSSNYFTVTDYIGGDANQENTYKTKIIPYSEREVGPGLFDSDTTELAMVLGTESVLDYANLQKLFSGDGTGKAPIFSFELESIPAAGEQGILIVNFALSDGYPDYWFAGDVQAEERYGSTKTIKANIKLTWTSDGENISITMPAQTVQVQYESGDILIEKEWANVSADVLSISKGATGTNNLDLKLTKLFSDNSSADGIDMSAFFTEGRYFLTTEFEGLDVQTATTTDQKSNSEFSAIQTLFRVEQGSLNWYGEDVVVDESAGVANVTINLSRAVDEDVTFTYYVYPATYGFINDEDTLEYVNTATGSDFGDSGTKWTGPNGESYPYGTVTIPAGSTTATVTIPIDNDGLKETSEYFLTAFFADALSDGTSVSKSSRHPQVEIENSTTFEDVLNISLDTLWRMSWDNRTWKIRGDDHDTVRLVGYESSWSDSSGGSEEYFEPFRFNGQQTVDGVLYNVYDLWDARVLIEDGVTVIFKKRDLGKVSEGENSQPDFWYKWGTVKENETSVFGKVRDSYDQDGDTITYSIDTTYQDGWLFDIDSSTGELTWKVAPDYEVPNSVNTNGITDFTGVDDNQMRHYNNYQVRVIGNDGSGESNATKTQDLWIEVKNIPDYEGYDASNKIPFFKDMWGQETQFIDDATDQSVKIKGFDLDFDELTWEITGMYAWGKESSDGWGTIWDSYRGKSVDNAPLQISQDGIVTPKTTLSYESGYTSFEIVVSITDGKSNPVTKQYHITLKDSLDDGFYEVNGHAQLVGYLSGATVFQDLDNDGVQDAGEPSATTGARGNFTLSLTKAVQDSPILVKGGVDLGTGLTNDKTLSINANLPFASNRDWGEYSMTPLSAVTLALQNLDRSVTDKTAMIDITKAMGFENGWVEGDGNFHGDPFWQFMSGNLLNWAGDWDVHQLNLYVAHNLVNLLGDIAGNGSSQITKNVMADIMAAVEATTGAAGVTSSTTISSAQAASIQTKAYDALVEAIAEVVTGLEAYDGFRLGKTNPVKIIDHEMVSGSYSSVTHTPSHEVNAGVMTLNTQDLEINRSTLQDALDLADGAKGLLVQVEVGALPTTAETITFTGKLIDGNDATIDDGERAIEISFRVTVDPTQEIGSANYVYVPAGEVVTITYTGEDGNSTETTVSHGDVMVTIENPITGGAPVFKVDLMKVFSKGMPLADLSTYFANDKGSNGDYYAELEFAGSSLQTSDGDTFTKVIAPFSVSDSPKPIAYISDVTINEGRGWAQVEVNLSKPAEADFTINYKFAGGTATQNEDYWWWSDNAGYRSITFLEGQSNAIINLDVAYDEEAESTETFNIELSVATGSEGNVALGTESVTVTIIDDDGASTGTALNSDTLVAKVISKVTSTLVTEIKTVLDSNSGTLDSVAATYSEILTGGNAEISDITTYITSLLTTESGIYDDILSAVMSLTQEWVSYLRGPTQTNLGNKINAPDMATDIAALTIGIDAIDLTSFEGTAADGLKDVIVTSIFTNSGFKFNGPATTSEAGVITADKTVESASSYDDVVMPAGKDLVGTRWENISEAGIGTSGDDTVTVTGTDDWSDVYYFGGAGDDVITGGGNNTVFIQGGVGDDTLKTGAENYHRLDGGPGDDILSAGNFNKVYYTGSAGSDVFVIEAASSTWNTSAMFNGNDRNWDGTTDLVEFWDRPGVISDFKDGVDKIGLRGDWNNKTVVIKQGSNEGGSDMSEHTILYGPEKNEAGEYTQIIGIIANTFAGNLTAADFVLLDSSYNQTAISSGIDDITFASSISFNGGTNVGAAQSGVLIFNSSDSSPTTYAITGGADNSLLNIDSLTGALTFKESVSATTVTDFDKDGNYEVEVTATSGSTEKTGTVSISVSVDTTYASYSNLAFVQATNSQGQEVVYITGNLTDDSAALSNGSIRISLRHESKGARMSLEANDWNGTINDDGSFQTNSTTLDAAIPDGNWYVEEVNLQDDAGNEFTESFRGATDSSPLTLTITNPIYLGNSDTTLASYSELALKVADGELSITGKLIDDGAPLTVAQVQIEIVHTVTGARKWFNANTEQIAADGTFETRSETLKTSDPSGLWILNYIRLRDDAGNEFSERYTRGDDSNPMQATLTNDSYLGDSDNTSATASNFQLVETVNWDGKSAIQITGSLTDDGSPLTSGEVSITLKHAKSGNQMWLNAGDDQIDASGNFETWMRTLENNDPSGTWYISEIRVKDDAGNTSYDRYEGAQDSSPAKFTLTNSAYTGGQAGDPAGTDFTAPAYANLLLTIVNDGDGTSTLKLTGSLADPSGVDRFQVGFKNANDSAGNKFYMSINGDNLNEDGTFEITQQLDSVLSGTWIAYDWYLRDDLDNQIGGNIDTGSAGSPELGLSFAWTNPDIDATDKTAPVFSNLAISATNTPTPTEENPNLGADTYSIQITGTVTDTSDVNNVQFRLTNTSDASASNIWMNTSTFDAEGGFTISQSVEEVKGGTWIVNYIQTQDVVGNQYSVDIESGGAGSALEGLTFDIVATTENVSDKTAPALGNLSATISADGDGTFTLTVAGTATDDSDISWMNMRFTNTVDGDQVYTWLNSGNFDSSGNFSRAISLDDESPGTYVLDQYTIQDQSGNQYGADTRGGGDGSPFLSLSFNYASVPTDISFTATTIEEESYGTSLGVVKVNSVDNNGLYTLTISGADSASLEVSSKGHLRLLDGVKLDYETKATLDFTIQAENATGDTYSENFSINVIDVAELSGSSVGGATGISIILDPDNSGISFDPGNGGNVSDVKPNIYELGITVDSIEQYSVSDSTIISDEEEDEILDLLNSSNENEVVAASFDNSLAVIEDIINEEDILFTADII